ncbi:MAG TPA: hypothetical protein VLE94_12075 [Burkholderiaceae bacterium]|nr:hypothetical protein [Burkholderiaceae bacterium]
MRTTVALTAAALCGTLLLATGASRAQASEDWKFQAIIYGYLPSVGGTTTLPGTGGGSSATVDAATIIDNLKFTFMGSLEASKGPWGVFTDVIYLDLGNSKSQSRDLTIGGVLPAGVTANIDFNLKGWLWTLAGSWRAVTTPTYKLDVFAGARMLDMDQTLDWQLNGSVGPIALPDRAGSRSVGMTNWDAIAGVKGRAAFGDGGKWFVPYYLDVGAGQSKFTWQAVGGVGYSFGWGDVIGAWRYVGYDMKSGKPIESVNFSGPAIGALFRW